MTKSSTHGYAEDDRAGKSGAFFQSSWVQFLVGDVDALPLRVFEVSFTLCFWLWMGHCFLEWKEWLTDWGFHLNEEESRALGYPPPLPLLTSTQVVFAGLLALLAGAGVIFNRCRRPALLVLVVFSLYAQGVDFVAASTVNKFFVAIYGILLVCPGYYRVPGSGEQKVSVLAVRVIQATLILEYFASGLAKAFVGDWLKHHDVLYTLIQGEFRTDLAAWALRNLPVWSWSVMQWTALLFELEAPLLFGVAKLRPVAFVIGVGFHLMIALLMKDLIFFSAVMWTFYVLFLSADKWRRWLCWRPFRARPPRLGLGAES